MKKLILITTAFLWLAGCASITGSRDLGRHLTEVEFVAYSYATSEDKALFLKDLVDSAYKNFSFERDIIFGLTEGDIKQILSDELEKYLSNTQLPELSKRSDSGELQVQRYIKIRETFDTQSYDPTKEAFLVTYKSLFRFDALPESKNYVNNDTLTDSWPLKTKITTQDFLSVINSRVRVLDNKLVWEVSPLSAIEFIGKARDPYRRTERIEKMFKGPYESHYYTRYNDKVDIFAGISGMKCVHSIVPQFGFVAECFVLNENIFGRRAVDE